MVMPSIECVLHGNLEDNLPEGNDGKHIHLQCDAMPSIQALLDALNIDPENVQFALVGGQYIHFERWQEPVCAARVQFWPRISGG